MSTPGIIHASKSVNVQQSQQAEKQPSPNQRPNLRVQAATYFKEHRLEQLFDRLCSVLIFHKPEDPNAFLIEQLQRLQSQREQKLKNSKSNAQSSKSVSTILSIPFFQDGDLEAMFGLMDPLRRGFISSAKAEQAFVTLGIPQQLIHGGSEMYSSGHFVRQAQALLAQCDEAGL